MEEKTREQIVTERVSDFQHSFQSGPGKRTLEKLSKFCLEKKGTFVEDSERKSSYNEGARSVILEIRRWLEYDLTKLRKEPEDD